MNCGGHPPPLLLLVPFHPAFLLFTPQPPVLDKLIMMLVINQKKKTRKEEREKERHTLEWFYVENQELLNMPEHRKHRHRGPQSLVLQTHHLRTFGLEAESHVRYHPMKTRGGNDMDQWIEYWKMCDRRIPNIHLRTHSGRPPKRSVCPALHAGESGDRLRGMFRSEIMTLAQYAPLGKLHVSTR